MKKSSKIIFLITVLFFVLGITIVFRGFKSENTLFIILGILIFSIGLAGIVKLYSE
jgi:hypothetical protein